MFVAITSISGEERQGGGREGGREGERERERERERACLWLSLVCLWLSCVQHICGSPVYNGSVDIYSVQYSVDIMCIACRGYLMYGMSVAIMCIPCLWLSYV